MLKFKEGEYLCKAQHTIKSVSACVSKPKCLIFLCLSQFLKPISQALEYLFGDAYQAHNPNQFNA